MKSKKKLITGFAAALMLSASTVTVFAASAYSTPAQALAGITGKTVESVVAEKTASGKSYGTIAKEAGKLGEFQTAVLEMKKDTLAAQVASGKLTQEQADAMLQAMAERQASCDGSDQCVGTGCSNLSNRSQKRACGATGTSRQNDRGCGMNRRTGCQNNQ